MNRRLVNHIFNEPFRENREGFRLAYRAARLEAFETQARNKLADKLFWLTSDPKYLDEMSSISERDGMQTRALCSERLYEAVRRARARELAYDPIIGHARAKLEERRFRRQRVAERLSLIEQFQQLR